MATIARLALFAFLLIASGIAIVPLLYKTENTDIIRINLDGGYANGINQVQVRTNNCVQLFYALSKALLLCLAGDNVLLSSPDSNGYGLVPSGFSL